MIYKDDAWSPRTADDARCKARRPLTVGDARKILKEHEVKGRSKLSGDEALELVRRDFPADVERAVDTKTVLWRWPVAHGLRVTYAELWSIEKAAGVLPVLDDGTHHGHYSSFEDMAKVYEAAPMVVAERHAVRIRISYDDDHDAAAADEVMKVLDAAFELSTPEEYEGRDGRINLYFEAVVPISNKN